VLADVAEVHDAVAAAGVKWRWRRVVAGAALCRRSLAVWQIARGQRSSHAGGFSAHLLKAALMSCTVMSVNKLPSHTSLVG
jgi:hypothetical protein